jgi:MoaA/NifB/PqqE/SkfB family radical SAM enzyme
VRDAGLGCTMATNGALLDERRGDEMLSAGLQRIYINVGDRDEAYEDVYALPFEKTRDNVLRFVEKAAGRCSVYIVLVNYRNDLAHQAEMERYWRDLGITEFIKFDIMNRGGSLFVEHMQYQEMAAELARAQKMLDAREGEAVCGNPFWQTFVGYDGQVYLCCSDWEKRAPVGSVFDTEAVLTLSSRLQSVRSREPICKTCNHDPLNHLAGEIRAIDAGECTTDVEALADLLVSQGSQIVREVDEFEDAARLLGKLTRKRIPVRAV